MNAIYADKSTSTERSNTNDNLFIYLESENGSIK